MRITVNGAAVDVADDILVDALVAQLGYPQRGVAVALGDDVVPHSRWTATAVPEGANVEILTAVQGG